MKKITAILICIALALCVCACEKTDDSGNTSSSGGGMTFTDGPGNAEDLPQVDLGSIAG